MNTSTPVPVLKQVKESFSEEVSALPHLTADKKVNADFQLHCTRTTQANPWSELK
jgi:hypothetical protein